MNTNDEIIILNVLAERYASPEIKKIFHPISKIKAERDLWIAVMKGQRKLGMNIPSEDIEKFEKARDDIDLGRIKELEFLLKHEPNNKIKAFIETAGAGEYLHLGMTSRDLTDNVEQSQILKASKIIFGKYVSILRHLKDKSLEYKDIELTARTHHQPAQPTLLGRRFSMWAEELIEHLQSFETFIDTYPLRGIKGPVGTQADMLRLLGSQKKVRTLEEMIANELGFKRVLDSPGQVYPRSLDHQLCSHLALLTAAPANLATGMRLMAGYELVTEGFKEGQVGSSAMPHKMNTKNCERICNLADLVKMYNDGASRNSGNQWEEGDVSCSVMRRVIIPDIFYSSDGLCETTLTVLNDMGVYPIIIEKELDKYLPFLATTAILAEATKAGIGREKAHAAIKKHAKDIALEMREKGIEKNTLASRLAKEDLFKQHRIDENQINKILANRRKFVGNAYKQIESVATRAKSLIYKYPKQAKYEPKEIL